MKLLLLVVAIFTLQVKAQTDTGIVYTCSLNNVSSLAQMYAPVQPPAASIDSDTTARTVVIDATAIKEECKSCIDRGFVYDADNSRDVCVCANGIITGSGSSKNCEACPEDTSPYVATDGTESCLPPYLSTSVPSSEADCVKYGMSYNAATEDTPASCGGNPVSRNVAGGTGTGTGTGTETVGLSSADQIAFNALTTDDEKKDFCKQRDMKFKNGSCEEKGGLFGGGGGGGFDFDSVTSVAGEALGNETVQNALLGAASGMGIGMVTSKFFSQTCEDEIKDDKCFDAAIELKKNEALRGHCEENKAKAKCKDHFFANDRGFFKTNWCDDEENVMDADMKTKCFNISKDSYFETHCTEEKMGNLKTPECFEMKTANPKKFFEIYCSEGSAVQALPEFKSAGADRECAVMKKNPSINEDYDPDEESDDEDEDYDEDEDMDEDDSDDVAEYDSDDEGDNSDDDSEDMDDDEIADSDSDSDDYSDDEEDDGDLFADSDTGRAIASMEHSSVSQDLSASSDDKIMQLANMGHFNGDPALCEGSIYQVDSNCSMRKHANYLIKGKLGRVKIVGQKTLVCVYENHTGARFSAVIKKDCQL